jgi:chromosome transmission fidelity protein 8
VRKRERADAQGDVEMGEDTVGGATEEELEIAEVVRYKIVFSNRPEPVGGGEEGE